TSSTPATQAWPWFQSSFSYWNRSTRAMTTSQARTKEASGQRNSRDESSPPRDSENLPKDLRSFLVQRRYQFTAEPEGRPCQANLLRVGLPLGSLVIGH